MKKIKILMVLAWILIMTSPAFAVSNLSVSGITSPVAANGIYVFQSVDGNGYNIWKHQSANYYIHAYYDGTPWWLIDNDTDGDNGELFYDSQGGSSTPTAGVIWGSDSGTGSPAVAYYSVNPEINLSGNGASIVSGDNTPSFSDYTKFGSALPNSGTATRTFTIQNTGAAALTVGAISFTGTNHTEFTVTTSPASSVAASGSTSFTVTFTPTGTGDRNATISIVNNDSDENPYTFAVNGYGYTTKALVVTGITTPSAANGNYISQGVLNNFQYWKHATENYYIFNYLASGVSPAWVIDNDQIGTNGSLFYCVSEAVSPNGLSWTAQYGTVNAVVSESTPTPEINLVGNNSQNIASGDNSPSRYDGTNFGSLDYSSGTRTRTYTIQNTGTAALTLSGSSPYVSLSGATSDFSVSTAPSNSIAASGSTTFVVTFNPASEGTKTAVVTITNNDSDEGTYTFTIQGDGFTPKNLVLSGVATPSAFNGTYTYQGLLNEFQYWKYGSYYIYNSDNGGTEDGYWYIDSDTNRSAYYFKSSNNGENGFPVNVTSWTASLGTGSPVIQYAAPEINITGNSETILDGDATPSIYDYTDFGWITSGTVIRTYTIQNLGTETLTLTGTSPYVVIGGTNSADFSVTTTPSATIAAGGSTTFQVTAAPSALGVRSATLSIANTDADENPYNFSIQADLGILPVVTTQAVSNIGTTNAIGNGNITTLGSPNPTAYGICYGTTINPDVTGSKVDKGTASATGAFTAQLTGLTIGTTYHVRAFATNNVGTSYGSDVTFTTTSTMTEPGNALNFDGSNDYVVATDNDNSLTAFTIEAWVKWNPSSTSDVQFICGKEVAQMELHTGGGAGANGLRFIPTTNVWLDGANVLPTGVWTHVAVVYNPSASLAKMYINGVEVTLVNNGSNPLSTAITNTATLFYLGSRSDGSYRFKGSMDEVRVWNLVRSQSEIQADMVNSISPSSSGLINYYNFNEGTTGSMMLPDLTSNGYNGTLTNFALTGATSNWVESYAMVVPTATAANSLTASGFTANWTAPATGVVTNYKLYVATDAAFSSLVSGYNPLTVASTSSAVTGLAANTTYYYRVCANKTSVTGEGAYSNTISLNTLKVPTVTTQTVTSISTTTATGNGTITDLGIPSPTAYGICWNTTGTPTTSDSKNDKGAASATGAFTASMASLTAGTTYHVRAFATNTAGTVYGAEEDFTTLKVPTVTTQAVSGIGTTTATGNGNITDLGVPNPTAYGVCWNTTGTPTTSDSKNDKGAASATGAFTASMASLTAGTSYHVRAFATNTVGTVYGAEEDFTTLKVPTVTTQAVSGIGTTTATGNGTITDLGIPNPTAYGICWNTTGTPTTSDSKNDKGAASATGAFTASMASLTAGTTYHVRAFATNTAGTVYGAEEDFTTLKVPTVTTQAVSGIGTTTATGNGTITDLGIPNPTAYGVCWNTTGSPTTSDSKNDKGAASATGAFTASMASLTAGTSYHVRAFATNTAGTVYGAEEDFTTLTNGTWTGATNSNWATATNWASGSVPNSTSDVIIPDVTNDPIIGVTTSADCHNLTVNSGANLTIASTSLGTGSLIVQGTSSGSVTVERYLTGSAWHMVSSPVSGQSIASFLSANSLIDAKPSSDIRAMKNYLEATDLWSELFTNTTPGSLGGGNGFAVWPTVDGIVNFSGTLQTGITNVTVTRTLTTGYGWNLVGNPYSSAVAINANTGADNFIALNSSNLTPSYAAIYLWEQGSNAYTIINQSSAAFYAQSGQGFFVKAAIGATQVSFTPALQSHQTGATFKSGTIPWPEIKLTASLGNLSNNTVIRFNDAMNHGLDVGYDAGILKSGFDLYTRLVDDNGVDFGIQCLPLEDNNDIVIPIGLESNTKGTVALSVDINNLPTYYQLALEDRETGMVTPVNKSGQVANIQVAAKSKLVGRFFLHTSYLKNTTGITSLPEDWHISIANGQICISGSVTGQSTATIYDLLGRKVVDYPLQQGSLNYIPCSDYRNGVYLISIKQQHGMFTKKISVIN